MGHIGSVTFDENDQVTRVPTVEVQSPTGSLNINTLVKEEKESDVFSSLSSEDYDKIKGQGEGITAESPNKEQEPDPIDFGKNLLAGYANWKDDEANFDPQNDPLRYIWYDAPELILAAILAGGIAYKGVQGIGGLVSSGSSTGTSNTTTQPSIPLEDRPYRIFVSHSWKYSEQHERIEEFLDSEEQLTWKNFSIPEDDPLEFEDSNDLRQQLYQQVGQSNVVIVISGMYVSHSEWIEEEIEMAKHFEKPIIGVQPYGNERLPKSVKDAADEVVGWRQQSIVNAIAKYA